MTIRIAGIGGTGVVTTAHLWRWAAMIDGIDVSGLDQTGLSQKAGPVVSDLRIGPGLGIVPTCSEMTKSTSFWPQISWRAVRPSVLSGMRPGHTAVVGSTAASLTGPMVLGLQERHVPDAELQASLSRLTGPEDAVFADAEILAIRGGAASSMANVVLLGIASQRGVLPVSAEALEAAIERNDVSVKANLAAFRIGRSWAAGALRAFRGHESR